MLSRERLEVEESRIGEENNVGWESEAVWDRPMEDDDGVVMMEDGEQEDEKCDDGCGCSGCDRGGCCGYWWWT